MATAYIQKL
jgi:hypothetical protein